METPARCLRCGTRTPDVCIACRRPVCRACGWVAYGLFRPLGLPLDQPVPADVAVPVTCRTCRARE